MYITKHRAALSFFACFAAFLVNLAIEKLSATAKSSPQSTRRKAAKYAEKFLDRHVPNHQILNYRILNCQILSYQILNYQVRSMGCASVLNTWLLRSILSGEKTRNKYFMVSARK